MPWGAVAGAAISVAGNALTSDKKGGAGSSQSSNEPWANAQPLLVQTLNNAYGLGDKYAREPISPLQQTAYDQQFALSDYARDLVPSLLGQIEAQPLGYDKNNPTARPRAWNFNAPALSQGMRPRQAAPAPVAAPAAAPAESPRFVQQGGQDLDFSRQALSRQFGNPEGMVQGSYGSYKYGDPLTEANQMDARMYALLGGVDPYGQLTQFRPQSPSTGGTLALLAGGGGA